MGTPRPRPLVGIVAPFALAGAMASCALAVDWNALRRGDPGAADGSGPSGWDPLGRSPDGGLSDAGRVILLFDAKPETGTSEDASVDGSLDGGDASGPPAGACTVDASILCSDPSQLGVFCYGGAVPTSTDPASGLACSFLAPQGPGESGYCCTGDYCGFAGFSTDPAGCRQCYTQNCGAVFCKCVSETDVDDAGTPYCLNYVDCVNGCNDPSLADCESQCSPDFWPEEIAEGNAMENCVDTYCSSQCE